jgi:hypothetical protein
MKGFQFPRTYADLDAAPWCFGYEAAGDGCFIYIKDAWLPDDWDEASPWGETLKEALSDLYFFWRHMRPPSVNA